MQTVSTSEASASLPELLKQVKEEPVLIRDGECDIAVLISPEGFRQEQQAKVEAFERSRDAMVMELSRNLALEGINYDQFVKDFLS